MTVSRNFSAVIKVVEDAELQRQFVLVGRDVGAVKRQRWIAIADFQIADHLIIGAVLFYDVDNVLDRILPAGELNRPRILMQQVVVLYGARKLFKFAERRWNV